MRIEYHRTLIADRVRNDALHAALKAVIRPGETTVADIGAGTGFIGLLAAKLGARKVHLYECAAVARVAEAAIELNRARNCRLYPCHSTEMKAPPRVDVVVSETLGNYPLEEHIVHTMRDARRRHLKPGGVLIPRRIVQLAAPVVTARVHSELTVWDRAGLGLDLAPARTMSLNNIYVRTFEPSELLEDGRSGIVWDRIDFALAPSARRKGEGRWKLARPAVIYGFATWWTAELVPGVEISTAPGAPRTHWEQLYFPLLEPIDGQAGETVVVRFNSRSSPEAGTHLAWTGLVLDRSGRTRGRQALDLDKGFLP
jgi:protein arginine N-methyltransferase 1